MKRNLEGRIGSSQRRAMGLIEAISPKAESEPRNGGASRANTDVTFSCSIFTFKAIPLYVSRASSYGHRRMDEFAAPDDYSFAKTIMPVRLAQHEGEKLVSRSQAKCLTMRFERFQTVVLDFASVEEIGQAFADEIFRVFQSRHPDIEMIPLHMEPAVEAMVSRAKAHG